MNYIMKMIGKEIMYIINQQKDGDGYYHIHTLTCNHAPRSNYTYCDGTIRDAALKIGALQSEIKKCYFCM